MMYQKISWKVFAFVFGLFILNVFLCQNPVLADGNNTDIKSSEQPSPRKVASDTNGDGKPDRWQYYDEKGQVTKVEADTNYDGKVDEWAYYENGKLVRVEKDSHHDGKVDQWIYY